MLFPMRLSDSDTTGENSTQWPSASITGWLNRALIDAALLRFADMA
jgi:hypothetical protein